MSEDFKIIAVGSESFILPFALAGLETFKTEKINLNTEAFKEEKLKNTLYFVDEDALESMEVFQDLQEKGANITLLKPWGKSEKAEKKIKQASIKAMGVDLLKE